MCTEYSDIKSNLSEIMMNQMQKDMTEVLNV